MKNYLLQEMRERYGWTQQDLADKLGITKQTVGRWERGEAVPHRTYRRQLCTLFGRTEQELGFFQECEDAIVSVSSNSIYDPFIPLSSAIRLVGREDDIAQITDRLCTGGSVALTSAVNGLPGVGKTALAIALAHDERLRTHFADGVLWAALGPQPNLFGNLNRWGELLGIPMNQMALFSSVEAKAQAIRTTIGMRSFLLIIDDAWQLEEALAFKVGGAHCGYLLTTRFPQIAAHMSIDGATPIHELSEEKSMALLQLIAPGIIDREPQKALKLVRAVGGLPLALTLIGNYLRKQAYIGPPRRITAALERFYVIEERLRISEPRVLVEAHPSLSVDTALSLEAILAVTDQRLSASARSALYVLAVLPPKPNTFSEEMALEVAHCYIEDLDELVDAGFLEYSGERYRLHQVISDYARLHLTGEEEHEAYDRLMQCVTAYGDRYATHYEMLEAESALFFLTLDAAEKQKRWNDVARIMRGISPFLLARGFYTQADHYLQHIYTYAIQTDTFVQDIIPLLFYRGSIAKALTHFVDAKSYFLEGLQRAQQRGDQQRTCDMLAALGNLIWHIGEHTQSLAYLQEGIALARNIHYDEIIYRFLIAQGAVLGEMGEYDQATIHLQEALLIMRQGERQDESMPYILVNLATIFVAQGYDEQAEVYLQEALQIACQVGHREMRCAILLNLGEFRLGQEAYTQAGCYFHEAFEIAHQLDQKEWISVSLCGLGSVASQQGEYHQAEAHLREGLQLARQIGRPRIMANALYAYGNFALLKEPPETSVAEEYFQEMLTYCPPSFTYDPEIMGLVYYGLGRLAAAKLEWDRAHEYGQRSIAIFSAKAHALSRTVERWLITLPT